MRPRRPPIPPGWPGDDPTVPEDLAVLGHRRRGRHRRATVGPSGGTSPDVSPGPTGGPAGLGDGDDGGDRPDSAAGAGSARVATALDDRPDEGDRHPVDGHDDEDDLGPPAEEQDDLVAGRQPAGRVLVVLVAALLIAMLVNADALVERAERQPAGRERDRALAVWHPVQDVSHVLQLHRIRQVADRLAGDDDGDDRDDPVPSTDETRRRPADDGARETTATTEAAADPGASGAPAGAPELRTPTADDPLRLWVGGDSMTQLLGPSLAATAEATGVVAPTVHTEMASGLTRPDYFDWPAGLRADVAADDPEVVVVAFGINDGQGIVLQDGTPVPEVADPRWPEEYRRRVAAVMDQLRADDRLVLWVLPPPMRDADYAARMAVIREAVTAEAADRPWVLTVDPAVSVADPAGAYADALPDATGAAVEVRQGDGIHLSQAGADRLAAQVLEAVGTRADLTGSSGGGAG